MHRVSNFQELFSQIVAEIEAEEMFNEANLDESHEENEQQYTCVAS